MPISVELTIIRHSYELAKLPQLFTNQGKQRCRQLIVNHCAIVVCTRVQQTSEVPIAHASHSHMHNQLVQEYSMHLMLVEET